jgi:2-polyprenyl-6-hydroxyphenyl methylase/3-demethylubiquinone-9 3-methyltransferase
MSARVPAPARVFEIGCGNGVNARRLESVGYDVTATDASASAIDAAQSIRSAVKFHRANVYEDMSGFGTFDAVIALEVIEHLYSPRELPKAIHRLLRPGGYAFISTPYHGYMKNLALAVTGRLDSHFTTLWDNGHIKFFNVPQLRQVITEANLEVVDVRRLGRIPPFARSMLAIARR